jgi:hypothetical protein
MATSTKGEDEAEECTICLEPIVFRGGAPIFSPGCCGGSFHLACVVALIGGTRRPSCCPNCRATLTLPTGLKVVTNAGWFSDSEPRTSTSTTNVGGLSGGNTRTSTSNVGGFGGGSESRTLNINVGGFGGGNTRTSTTNVGGFDGFGGGEWRTWQQWTASGGRPRIGTASSLRQDGIVSPTDTNPNPYRREDGIHRPAARVQSPPRAAVVGLHRPQAPGVQGNPPGAQGPVLWTNVPIILGAGGAWTIVAFRGEHSLHPSTCPQCAGKVSLTASTLRCPCGAYSRDFSTGSDTDAELAHGMQQVSIS